MIKHRVDLYKLLPDVSESICAEIGVAEGYFSYDMLSWGIKKLYLVDMWESHPEMYGDAAFDQQWHNLNYQATMKRVEKYESKIKILRGPSAAMAQYVEDNSLDLIHIDACHSYECVTDDLKAWLPKMKIGGIISGHDWNMLSVKNAVIDFCRDKYSIEILPENKSEDAGYYFFV